MVYFTENILNLETASGLKSWTVQELLEMPDPLSELALAARNAALRKAAELVNKSAGEITEIVRLKADFWLQFSPGNISECTYLYTSNPDSNNHWELTINGLGLSYKDISGEYYYPPGKVTEQLFSDFWFYGPLQPLPDLRMREKIIALMREAFQDPECLAAGAHFDLFEYPALTDSGLYWEEGDHVRRDFVAVRGHGIEYGYSTWRDVQPLVGYLSFERFLYEPPPPYTAITPVMRTAIEQFLGRKSGFGSPDAETEPSPPTPPTPREQMDLAEQLLKSDSGSEKGAETLMALLLYEAEESYWRNYVFNYCFKLRGNKKVEQFIVDCLCGDNEIHFKKAVDVLQMWGIYGDTSFQNRSLLLSLNWEDATANDPAYREALGKTIKLIHKQV
ncbi:MAG: hypothetical protein J0M29_00285 [Chitinophagales bacterium]|nr:hypothetical protein [Chitinophagales bacterium]